MPGALRDAHVAVVKMVGVSKRGPHVTFALIIEGGEDPCGGEQHGHAQERVGTSSQALIEDEMVVRAFVDTVYTLCVKCLLTWYRRNRRCVAPLHQTARAREFLLAMISGYMGGVHDGGHRLSADLMHEVWSM